MQLGEACTIEQRDVLGRGSRITCMRGSMQTTCCTLVLYDKAQTNAWLGTADQLCTFFISRYNDGGANKRAWLGAVCDLYTMRRATEWNFEGMTYGVQETRYVNPTVHEAGYLHTS
eukprot:1158351-Pelagomonas_calceolata.AAC.6